MSKTNKDNVKRWSVGGSRVVFGEALVDIGEQVSDVVAVTADLADSTCVRPFAVRFPERFFQVGVAEQNLVGIASGLALGGKIPFATTFGSFAATRCCEQVRDDVAYPNLNVKLVGVLSGASQGIVGVTHYGLEDLGIMRGFPNMVVLSPCDGAEVIKATWAAAKYVGPVYLRLTGLGNAPIIYQEDFLFEIGKAITLREGSDVALIATGSMVSRTLEVAEILHKRGISAWVVDMHTIKPLDREVVELACKKYSLVVSIEEHSIIGGLGSAVAEVMAEQGNASKLKRIGLPDAYLHFASYDGYLSQAGLSIPNIVNSVVENLHHA
jgi:transketolase